MLDNYSKQYIRGGLLISHHEMPWRDWRHENCFEIMVINPDSDYKWLKNTFIDPGSVNKFAQIMRVFFFSSIVSDFQLFYASTNFGLATSMTQLVSADSQRTFFDLSFFVSFRTLLKFQAELWASYGFRWR